MIVSEYLDVVIGRLNAERLLDKENPEEESAPETHPYPAQKDNIQKDVEL